MRKKKKTDKRAVRILLLMDLLLVMVPLLCWYFFGHHGYFVIRTGELVSQAAENGYSWKRLMLRGNKSSDDDRDALILCSLEELNEKFPGDIRPGNRVWVLYYSKGRLIKPEMIEPIWMMKLHGKYKRLRCPIGQTGTGVRSSPHSAAEHGIRRAYFHIP